LYASEYRTTCQFIEGHADCCQLACPKHCGGPCNLDSPCSNASILPGQCQRHYDALPDGASDLVVEREEKNANFQIKSRRLFIACGYCGRPGGRLVCAALYTGPYPGA